MRAHRGGLEGAEQDAVAALALIFVGEQVLHGDDLALHADDLGHVGDAADAVAHALDLHDQVDGATICVRIALAGRLAGGHPDHVLEAGERIARVLAWTVDIEPSWPVFIACSMSKASAPRTSPTMMRSGRMRSALLHELALRDLALALDVGRAGLQPHDMRLLQLQLGRVLDRDDALARVDQLRHRVSSVVLPEPVPPEIRMLSRHAAAISSESSDLGADVALPHHRCRA